MQSTADYREAALLTLVMAGIITECMTHILLQELDMIGFCQS